MGMPLIDFRLLTEFKRLFERKPYLHRASNQGDIVASCLYEDLLVLGRSEKFASAVQSRRDRVLNRANRRHGVSARRGDATFGELIPGEQARAESGYNVARGPIATVEVGVEVKILAKAMIKQIDRVINDLRNQVVAFRIGGGDPICIAVVGINHAERYVGFEGDRRVPTTGKGGFLHPAQECRKAESRLIEHAKSAYDEFIVLRFKATNEEPYPFEWVNLRETALDYAASLARIAALYQRRF